MRTSSTFAKLTTTLSLLALLAFASAAQAATYTWTQTTMAAQDWTVTGNWSNSTTFVSGSGNELRFFPDATSTWRLAVGTQTITNVPAALSMNTLTLNGQGPNNTLSAFMIIGDNTSTWTIGDGVTSTVNLNATAGGGGDRYLNYTIAPNLTLNQAITTFTGNGGGIRGFNFSGNITQAAAGYGITKSGSSILVFSGANSYSGATTVSGGTLRLASATALPGGIGATGGTSALTINNGLVELAAGDFQRNLGTGSDQFQITGGTSGFSAFGGARTVTVNNDASQEIVWGSADFAPSTLVLNASTADAALTLANKIDLNGTTRTVQVNASTAVMSGDVRTSSGTAGLTKTGAGTLVLSGANTYNGPTTISGGALSVGAANNLGDAAANLVFNAGTLQITGATLTNFSGIGHTVSFTAAKTVGLDISDAGNTFTVDQVLNQTTGGFTKLGAGTVVLNQANTYTGATTVSGGGNLILDYSNQNNSKLSDSTALTLAGTTLTLSGGTHEEVVSATTLSAFTGSFITRSSGAATIRLNAISRGNTWAVLSLSTNGIATTDTGNNSTGILGAWATVGSHWAINSTGGADGPITAYSSYDTFPTTGGSTATNYQLQGSAALTGSASANTLRIENTDNDQVLDIGTSTLTIQSFTTGTLGGILYAGGSNNHYTISGSTGRITPANGNGQALLINAYTGTLTVNANLTYGSSGFVKTGEGTLVLGGTNAFTGATYVYQGALLVNGDSSAMTGPLNIAAGATLGGTGTIGGAVTVNGTFSPGNSAGQITVGDLTLAGTYQVELNGYTVGTGYDQTVVNGTVSLSGALSVTSAFTPVYGTQFVIIDNDGADAISGTFAGLSEGAILDGIYQISYLGQTGNDVVLTVIPEPGSFILVGGGLALMLLLRRRRQ